MSVGAWEPEQQDRGDTPHKEIDRALLDQIINAMEPETESLNQLEAEITNANWLAGLPAQQWLEQANALPPEQVWDLIRFFTLAEMQLGWQGGAESPVIPMAKSLRQRKVPLSREQQLWIREHSDNRYLPYGPL